MHKCRYFTHSDNLDLEIGDRVYYDPAMAASSACNYVVSIIVYLLQICAVILFIRI